MLCNTFTIKTSRNQFFFFSVLFIITLYMYVTVPEKKKNGNIEHKT